MRAGLEGSFFSQPTTGSGQYVRGLWREFTREGGAPELEPLLLRPGPAREEEPGGGGLVVEEPPRLLARLAGPRVRKVWWELRGLPRAARRAGVELVHVPYFAALPRPGRPPVPYVVTIHDLVPLVLPVYTQSRAMRLYLRLARFTARRAMLILTDSQHSANDIVRYLGVPRERLRVVPLAADEFYRPLPPDDPTIAAARDKYGLDGPFILNVGGLDTRKNLGALIRAFALARPQLPAGMRLVVGGAAHTGNPEVYPDLGPVIAEAGVAPWVLFTGRISDEEKLALLNAADLYVFPSLYEGFGIPPLEAMRCGTPVVCSDRSSLPEVVGDGGLLVEPTPEKLGAAMAFALCTPHERQELRRRALEQAARFTWARTAELTLKAYREALDMAAERGKGRAARRTAGRA